MTNIFQITENDVKALSDADLRLLIAYLAEQELSEMGLSRSSVTYGGHQDAPDGGIDVRVGLENSQPLQGFVPRASTGFQVKAEIMQPAALRKEMRPGNELRPSIKELGERGGAYIVVSSKDSVTDRALTARRNAMAHAIADAPSASDLHVDFYDAARIASWVNQTPGLIPWVSDRIGKPLSGWRPYADWSSAPGAIDEPYLVDDGMRVISSALPDADGLSAGKGIDAIRVVVRKPRGVVRLVGLSGVGKTRFVQALFDDRIGTAAINPRLAIYTDMAEGPDPAPQELLSRLEAVNHQAVLIVDNCGVDLHKRLVRSLRSMKAPVSLITVEYDISDDQPEGTEVFKLEPTSQELIEKILARRYPTLSGPELRTIAEFSEGNSRIALALANTARDGQSLANLRDSELFERLFWQSKVPDQSLLRTAKACSLAYSFDGETLDGAQAELPVIAAIAGVTVLQLHEHVAELLRRQLVQKRGQWRALLPQALAHRLAKQFLEDLPREHVRNTFTRNAPERLLRSFSRRLGHLHDSPHAQAIAADWLRPDGYLGQIEKLNDLGLKLLENIAPIDPAKVLIRITEALGRTDLLNLESGTKSRLIKLLRAIAYDPEHFAQAAGLIGRLSSDGKKSNNSSDAANVFESLFYIYLSGTMASAEIRAEVIRCFANSGTDAHRALALIALEAMLECTHFSSSYDFAFGARKRAYGLYLTDREEITRWFTIALDCLREMAASPETRTEARTLLAKELPALITVGGLADPLCALACSFAADGGWPEGWSAARKALRKARKAKQTDDATKLAALVAELQPRGIRERIVSMVLPEEWSALDVADIDDDDEEKFAKARERIERECTLIGEELARDEAALVANVDLLSRSGQGRKFAVGASLGRTCTDAQKTWDTLIGAYLAQPEGRRNPALIGSFLSGLGSKHPDFVQKCLDDLLRDSRFHEVFVWIQVVVGLKGGALQRLVEAARPPSIPTATFGYLQMGRVCDSLSGDDFGSLLRAICERDDGLRVAIDILGMRLHSLKSDKRPVGDAERQIGRHLLAKSAFSKQSRNEGHRLAEIVETCLDPDSDKSVADQLCKSLLKAVSDYTAYAADYAEFVAALAASFPRSVLDILVLRSDEVHDFPRDLFRSFREHRACPMDRIDDGALLAWAAEDPDVRFTRLAQVVRPWRKADGTAVDDDDGGGLEWTPIALRLIREAPDTVKVLEVFVDRMRPGGWSGSLADVLEARKPLLELLCGDPSPVIARSAQNALAILAQDVANQRAYEARERRERDERFE